MGNNGNVANDDDDDDDSEEEDGDSFNGKDNNIVTVMPIRKTVHDNNVNAKGAQQYSSAEDASLSAGRNLLQIDNEFYSPCSISQTYFPSAPRSYSEL